MFEWPSLALSICFLFSAVSLQTFAAGLALHRFLMQGRRPAAWGWFSLALLLLIPLHWRPLELAIAVGVYDPVQTALALGISLFLLLAVAAWPGEER